MKVLFKIFENGFVILLATNLAACEATRLVPSPDKSFVINQAQNYLNNLEHFKAKFVQTGADGYAEGYVWLDRPDRLRVEYVRPSPRLMLANHGELLIADRLTRATTTMPVDNTPLDILLAPYIQLSGALTVTSIQQQGNQFQITAQKTAAPSQGSLTMEFSRMPIQLVGIALQDYTGKSYGLSFLDVDQKADFSPSLFQYDTDNVSARFLGH